MKRVVFSAIALVVLALLTRIPARADLPFVAANGTLTATKTALVFPTTLVGQGTCSVAIGTTTGEEVDFSVSVDGTHYTPVNVADFAGGSPVTSATGGMYHGDCSAARQFKVSVVSPTGGTAVSVSMLAAQASIATIIGAGGGGISSIIGTSPIDASTVSGTTTISCSTCITALDVQAGAGLSLATPSPGTFVLSLSSPVTVAHGGTGTASPAPVAGNCISLTGTWPNQTLAYSCATPGPSPTPFPFNASATSPIVVATPSAGAIAVSCPTCVVSVGAGSNVVIGGTATAPTVAVTAAPNFSALTVGSSTGCAILTSGALSSNVCGATITTSTTTMVAPGNPVTVNVALGVGFPNLSFALLSDGTRAFIGQVTSGGGTTALTMNVLQNLAGSPTNTIASGSVLTAAGPVYAAGTGLTLSGNSFALSTPVGIAQGGTNATTFTTNTCLRYDGTRIVSASADCATTPTLRTVLSVGLGFAAGVVATSTVYPYQQVANYTNGTLTELRVACATTDSGQTIFSLSKNGTQIATIQMTNGSATATSTTGFPVSIASGDVLHLANTQAGTATSCGVTADGTQQAF